MAQRRKRRSTRSKQNNDYPGWLWMIFGLAIGLSVAFAVYVKDRDPDVRVAVYKPEPASMQDSIDHNNETPSSPAPEEVEPEERFDFYKMLPAFVMVVDGEDEEPAAEKSVAPQAIDEPGIYMLQAGSFSAHVDADRRKAELALHGIESRVQRASVNNRDYYRVFIGPIEDLNKLNMTRSRLREAEIDVMRIKVVE